MLILFRQLMCRPTKNKVQYWISKVLLFQNAGCDVGAYKNIVEWLDRCKTLPGYEENVEGAKVFGQRVINRLTDKF